MATAHRTRPTSFHDVHVPNNAFAAALANFVPKAHDEGDQGVISSPEMSPQFVDALVVVECPPLTPEVREVHIPTPPPILRPQAVEPERSVRETLPPQVEAPRTMLKGNISVWDLFSPDPALLIERIKEHQRYNEKPVFAFFFDEEDERTSLAMSVTILGESVKLKVISGFGRLVVRFPVGTTFFVDELRGQVVIIDLNRQNMVNEFRRVMDILRGQLYFALSYKLTNALRGR